MTPHTYLEHGLSVLHARLRTPRQPGQPATFTGIQPFITLSRETGAGATALGQELVSLLDRAATADDPRWALLDRDLLHQALKHHSLPATLAEFLPEDRVSEIRATIGELVGLHPSLWQLEQKVAEAVLQLAHVGHVILAGRAAHLITRALPGGLHVRLVASRDIRVARIAQVLACTRADAVRQVDQQDEARRRFVRANFDAELDDPHAYDLVINTDHLSARASAEIVFAALRQRLREPVADGVATTGAAATG